VQNGQPEPDGRDGDEVASGLAERQCGAIAYRQLLASGLSETQIRRRNRSHRLLSTAARPVYRLPGVPTGWMQDTWVAVLAGPPATVVSHTSAAALHKLLDPPAAPHVTVSRTASGRIGGANVHHATLLARDRCILTGLPATTVARTIVDCASVLDQDSLDRLTDAAIG
jgi:predicted transcriptional regulator of viral defense system